MCQIFKRVFSIICPQTTNGAASTEVYTLDEESSQYLLIVQTTALYRQVTQLLEEIPRRQLALFKT